MGCDRACGRWLKYHLERDAYLTPIKESWEVLNQEQAPENLRLFRGYTSQHDVPAEWQFAADVIRNRLLWIHSVNRVLGT
jgi:hypothetical protein